MGPKTNKQLSHIASGLFPAASFVALPSTPIPEPESKNKPRLKPSPLYGALVGSSNLSRSIGGAQPNDGTARTFSPNPMYDTIDSEHPAQDIAPLDDDDADPGYTTVGSEASSLAPFFPRQRLLTPPPLTPRLDENGEDSDDDDGIDAIPARRESDERGRRNSSVKRTSETKTGQPHAAKTGESTRVADVSTAPPLNLDTHPKCSSFPGEGPQETRIRSQSHPIYSMPLKRRTTTELEGKRNEEEEEEEENEDSVTRLNAYPSGHSLLPSVRSDSVRDDYPGGVSPSNSSVFRPTQQTDGENAHTILHLRRAMEELRSEKDNLKAEADTLNRLVRSLQQQLKQQQQRPSSEGVGSNTEEASLLPGLADSLRNQILELETENSRLNEEILHLKRDQGVGREENQRAVVIATIHEEQNKEMRKEIRSLQITIQRLSVELSQAQLYSDSLTKSATITSPDQQAISTATTDSRDTSLPAEVPLKKEGPCPSWLVNMKYLSPLIGAYDEKLKDKDKILTQCRGELEELQMKVATMTEENSEWRRRLERVQQEERTRLNQEWTVLENHNQLLIRENQVLMTQIELKEKKMTSLIESSSESEARLLSRSNQLEANLVAKETEATSLNEIIKDLREKLDAVIAEDEGKMSIEEHVQELQDLKRLVTEMKEKHASEKRTMADSQRNATEEIESLQQQITAAVQGSELKDKTNAESDKKIRKMERKLNILTRKFSEARKLQEETQQRLEDVCIALEKSQADNAVLASLVEAESAEKSRVLDGVIRRSVDIEQMEEKLVSYRNIVGDKLVAHASKMQKLDLTYAQHRIEYRNRIKQLLRLIETKDRQLIQLAAAKETGLDTTAVENDVDIIYDSEAC